MRVAVTQEYFDRIVDGFRIDPGNFSAAARYAKVSRPTAKKAWTKGWEDYGFPPVKEVLELEQLEARKDRAASDEARLEQLKDDQEVSEAQVRAQARRDAIRARTEEGHMVAAARQSAIKLLETSRTMAAAVNDIAPRIAEALRGIDLEEADLKTVDAVGRILWRLAISTRAGSATAYQILQAERLLLGQPTDIIGITDLDNMDAVGAMKELEEAAGTLARMRARKAKKGGFLIIDGGSEKKDEGSERSA